MKLNRLTTTTLVTCFSALLLSFSAIAQNTINFTNTLKDNQAFVQNKGQFTLAKYSNIKVLYALDYGKMKIYLTQTGVVYHTLAEKLKTNEEREQIERAMRKAGKSHAEIEAAEHAMDIKEEFIVMNYDNASATSTVEATDKTNDYFSYMVRTANGTEENVNYVNGYKKITIQNIYPHINLEYTTHPTEGLKYAFVIGVGGDVSNIKMNYTTANIKLKNNNVVIPTLLGKVTDHAPTTFYNNESNALVPSKFIKTNNTIGFELGEYNHNKTIVIDPWTQTPTGLNNASAMWEVERDGAGNVYAIGGDSPMKLLKYNSAGVLQWTYNTTYDTAGGWLGTLATDLAGNSFITNGSPAAIRKVDNTGTLIWTKTGSGSNEYWSIAFNCDQTKLIVGGTKVGVGLPPPIEAAIFDIDVANGNILATKIVSAPANTSAIPPKSQEVRGISASRNARYYYLTHDTIGYINQNFSACGSSGNGALAAINTTYSLSYKCENYRSKGNSGIPAIKANKNFVYTQNGTTVHKRDLGSMAILASATIPGGASSTSLGRKVVENSGLDLDTCGNVYVGSSTGITKFDANLNLISSVTTAFKVYDIAVSTGGDVIAVGATGNSQSSTPRGGTIQSFNMGACFPIKLECCDASICPVPEKCTTDAAFQLTTSQAGGVFSGTGVSATGMFNPATAGAGTFSIVYTLPCGTDTLKIKVKACANLTVCKNSNGSLGVSGGTAPYTWEKIVRTKDCSGFCAFDCTLPQCTTYVTTYTTISTTPTATPSATTDTIRVTDSQGNTTTVFDQSTLPSCNACSFTPVISISQQPTTCTTIDGSVTVAPITGATYSWNTTPVQTTNLATNVAIGSYTCTVTVGACSTTVSITIPCNAQLVVCKNTNGSLQVTGGNAPYTWQSKTTTTDCSACPGGSCIPFVCAGTQVTAWVTFTTGTTATAPNNTDSVRVKDANGNLVGLANATTPAACSTACALVASITKQQAATCGGNNGTAVVTPITGATYSWNTTPIQTNDTAINLASGTYICTVTQGTCTDTAQVTIGTSGTLVANASGVNASCGNANGTATVNISGATYSWNTMPVQTTQTATALVAGTYICTVTQGTCTDTAKVTITNSNAEAITFMGDTLICAGTSTTLTATSVGATNYAWNTNPIQVSASITVTPNSNTYYTVAASNGTCVSIDSVLVTALSTSSAYILADTLVCKGEPVALTASTGTSYVWSPGGATSQSIVYIATVPGTYSVVVTNATAPVACRTSTASITINIHPYTGIDAGPDQTIKLGKTAILTATGAPVTGYTWINTNQQLNSIEVSPSATTVYTVKSTDKFGCVSTDSVRVTVDITCGDLFMPTAFSPNDDGSNDLQCVLGNCVTTIEWAIYDRWGEKVFESKSMDDCWNGTYKGYAVNTGVYAYKLTATLTNGNIVTKNGNITLMR